MTTLNIELANIDKYGLKDKELAQKIINALATSQPIPDWKKGKALEFLTTNDSVRDFVQERKSIIRNSIGQNLYTRNIIIGDFGAGKTHIKKCLLSELQSINNSNEILIASLELDNAYRGTNIYSEILSLPYNNQKNLNKLHRDIFNKLQSEADRQLIFNPLKLIRDILLERSVNIQLVRKSLEDLGFSDDYISAFIDLGQGKLGNDLIIENIINKNVQTGNIKEFFSRILDLLGKVKYRYVCIFLDEFSKIEGDGWNGHRESFVNELADLHDLLGEHCNKLSSEISIYLGILTYGRFWRGSPDNSLLQSSQAQRFMERFTGPNVEFEIPSLDDEDINDLFIKICALYQIAGYKVPDLIVKDSFSYSQDIFNEITMSVEEITPRRVIKKILNIISISFSGKTQPWLLD